ncbi:MAG: hypothetical protein HYY06_30925 [Deltaproteobacteria bacterium]|nr:hypothetical protein [Deltaproteobacteria bacterium]
MRRWIATAANFFFPGLGYLIAGQKRPLALGWLIGAIGLTYVELSLQAPMPRLYWTMFVSVFIMNLAFAVDVYRSFAAPASARVLAEKTA